MQSDVHAPRPHHIMYHIIYAKCGCSNHRMIPAAAICPLGCLQPQLATPVCLDSTALPTGLPMLLHVKQLRTQMPHHTIVCLPGCLLAGSTCHCTSPVYHRITNWITNTFKPPGQIHNYISSGCTHFPLCVYIHCQYLKMYVLNLKASLLLVKMSSFIHCNVWSPKL